MPSDMPPRVLAEQCPNCGAALPPEGEQLTCPYCGTRLARYRQVVVVEGEEPGAWSYPPAMLQRMWGYEYRSPVTLWGLPLVHIAQGIDPQTGRPRVARGIIAVGNIAFGVVAVGGVAFGGIAFGGVAVGALALAGMAVGVVALGGMAVALLVALGGMAIATQYAIGGMALAPHALGGNAQDPELLRWLEELFGAQW